MIRSFADLDTEVLFKKGKLPHKKGWAGLGKIAKRKLDMLDYANELKDLKSPPKNCLEKLKGDLAGSYSIRINDQWRIVFEWNEGPCKVKIVDYH